MATRKTTKATSSAKSDPNAFKVVETEDTKSQILAKLATSSTLSAATLKQFSGAGEDLEVRRHAYTGLSKHEASAESNQDRLGEVQPYVR